MPLVVAGPRFYLRQLERRDIRGFAHAIELFLDRPGKLRLLPPAVHETQRPEETRAERGAGQSARPCFRASSAV